MSIGVSPTGERWSGDSGSYRLGNKGTRILASKLDVPVLNILLQDLQSEEIILAILSHYNALAKKVTPDGKKEKKELAELDKRIGTLADLISQTSAPDALLRKIEQFETEREQIIRVLAEIEDEAKNKKILNQLTENDVRKMLKTVLEEIMNEDSAPFMTTEMVLAYMAVFLPRLEQQG